MAEATLDSSPDALCPECRGTGWLVEKREAAEVVVPCPACRTQERVRSLLRKAAIPPRYLSRGFSEYAVFDNRHQEKALEKANQYVHLFPNTPRGLLFVGPCGVGKTHLSVAILTSLIREKNVSGRFVDETELLRRLQYSYGPGAPETEREVLLPLLHVDLLVWDDLGTGRPTPWVAETIRTVLNHRYTYNKQTVLSTNLPLKRREGSRPNTQETLAERIGQHLFSRLMEMCEVVEIQGMDGRTEIHKAGLDFQGTGN